MANYICVTCGVQYADSDQPPARCRICDEPRQYINSNGQQWTTLEDLRRDHHNVLEPVEPGLTRIYSEPRIAIGQNPLLVQTPSGNVLWDCISLVDDATVEAINALGGISAIAISHPHFYDSLVEWSRAFGGVPVYLHAADRQWVMRPDPAIRFWEGETHALAEGVTLIRCGGHFDGSTALHWAGGAAGRGALFSSDTIMVCPDTRYVTFMTSYPNLIPMSASKVRKIAAAVEPFAFDRIYGGWQNIVRQDAKAAIARSVDRYIAAITG